MFQRLAAAFLFIATGAFCATITSLSPSVGPVEGGTRVTIKGTGFSNICINCMPPFGAPGVFFGITQANEVRFIDSSTLEAVTPAVFPQTVSVTVQQYDGTGLTTLPNAFTFQGDPNSAFDPILFPLFIQPKGGAFGSQFQTTVRLSIKGFSGGQLPVYGISRNGPLDDPPRGPLDPFVATIVESQPPLRSQTPGRILYVAKGSGPLLAASIRVTDLTKQTASFGVEVPVARRDNFADGVPLVFMGVPADSRFRCMLRLYSLKRGDVLANIAVNGKLYQLYLKHTDDQDLFEPAYLEFTDFPTLGELPSGQTTFRVVVDAGRGSGMWGMLSVTNNETQQITVITPN